MNKTRKHQKFPLVKLPRHGGGALRPTLIPANHKDILQKADRLYHFLKSLRYEKEHQLRTRMKTTERIFRDVRGKWISHIQDDECRLFPLVRKHFPRLVSAVRFLQTKYKETKVNLEVFEFLLWELPREKVQWKRKRTVEILRDKGLRLVSLMRHYLKEEESIHTTVNRESTHGK